MKPTTILLTALFLLGHCALNAQSKTGRKIQKTGKDMEETTKALKKGKELFNKVFKKNKREQKATNDSEYFVDFTIGEETFFLDVYNDSRWYTMHVRRDKENEIPSAFYMEGWKMGFANGGKRGTFTLIMVPKDRTVENADYGFEKGEDQYDPMVFFKFTDDETNYEMALPDKSSYKHSASGTVTIVSFENIEHGVSEGHFELHDITKSKKDIVLAGGLVAKGSFRVPVTLAMPINRPKPRE